jgi:hypothetical protein
MPLNYKPLTFTTTLRNPERAKYFLKVIEKFEGKKLTNDLAIEIVVNCIKEKIYRPDKSYRLLPNLKTKYLSNNEISLEEAWKLKEASDQDHTERGFDHGWSSRFYTIFAMLRKLGFIYFTPPNILEDDIKISELGKLLISCAKLDNIPAPWEEDIGISDLEKSVFANSLAKYQRKNPFTAELNNNYPLSLLIRTINLLNEDRKKHNLDPVGISRKEIPIISVWKNNDEVELFNTIQKIRSKHGSNPSDETILEKCDEISEGRYNSWQNNSLMKEIPDEFIRKMKITGLFTSRGLGRYLDLNQNRIDICQYVVDKFSKTGNYEYQNPKSEKEYYAYASKIDEKIINYKVKPIERASSSQLENWISVYSWEQIKKELNVLKIRNRNSEDPLLKTIDRPERLEFLSALAVKYKCPKYKISPNYVADDQGLPNSTAAGGKADIECDIDDKNKVLLEVTLKTDATGQIEGELVKIKDHINQKKLSNPELNISSYFVAPTIHERTNHVAHELYRSEVYNLLIEASSIDNFIQKLERENNLICQ